MYQVKFIKVLTDRCCNQKLGRSKESTWSRGARCAASRNVDTSMHLLVMDEVITSAMVSGSCCCSSASSCLSPRCLEACKQVPCQLVCASITFVLRARYVAGVQV